MVGKDGIIYLYLLPHQQRKDCTPNQGERKGKNIQKDNEGERLARPATKCSDNNSMGCRGNMQA